MGRTRFHLVFLLSGIGVAVFLGLHMAVQHLNRVLATGDSDPVSWLSMINRAAQSGWVIIYIFLLAFGIYHGLYGLRGILLESIFSEKAEKVMTWGLVAAGIIVFGWASYVPIALALR
jgi:succinate dehydrogenase hydrophobic anchor subunit